MHLATDGFGPEHRDDPWLSVDDARAEMPVIFARSERCRNTRSDWTGLWQVYRDQAGC
jgi:hypothetical protein